MEQNFFKIIDSSWTLFLDRDGVINQRPPNDYVKRWEDFSFIPGVMDALAVLAARFRHILVVTNQQGIGKKLMTTGDLQIIHDKMIEKIASHGGRIDGVYFCPDLDTATGNCRKPGLQMAQQAKKDFPLIDFQKSIMVGDTTPDMQFGRNAGMRTVYVGHPDELMSPRLADLHLGSLHDFARSLSAND